jgi:hypothetical protein
MRKALKKAFYRTWRLAARQSLNWGSLEAEGWISTAVRRPSANFTHPGLPDYLRYLRHVHASAVQS